MNNLLLFGRVPFQFNYDNKQFFYHLHNYCWMKFNNKIYPRVSYAEGIMYIPDIFYNQLKNKLVILSSPKPWIMVTVPEDIVKILEKNYQSYDETRVILNFYLVPQRDVLFHKLSF